MVGSVWDEVVVVGSVSIFPGTCAHLTNLGRHDREVRVGRDKGGGGRTVTESFD